MENGTYRARATSWVLGETSTGKEQVAVEFSLTDPELQGERIAWYGFFTEKTFERTIESLRACGWTGDNLEDLSGLDANEVDLVIEQETYEGKTTPRVRWVNRPGAIGVKTALAPEKAKTFAAKMKAQIRAFDASQGKKAAPASSSAPAKSKARQPVLSPEPPPPGEEFNPGF